jgi:hypothetical protein
VLLLALTAGPFAAGAEPTYETQLRAWRDAREKALRADDGWLTLAGRFPLKAGDTTIGAGKGNDLVLPPEFMGVGPDRLGTLHVDTEGRRVTLRLADGVAMVAGGKSFTGERAFGTDAPDWAYGVAASSADAVYVVGATYGVLDGSTSAGYFDGYLAKVGEDPLGTPTITQQPVGSYVRVGDEVYLAADATFESSWVLRMQWERNTGGGWEEITGETSGELFFIAAKADDGLYRMRFDYGGDSLYSDEVQVTVSDAAITVSSATVSKGSTTVTFSTSGTPALTTFQCNLGKGRNPWITCTSGLPVKGSGKTVTVRGQSSADAPWVYSAAKTTTR